MNAGGHERKLKLIHHSNSCPSTSTTCSSSSSSSSNNTSNCINGPSSSTSLFSSSSSSSTRDTSGAAAATLFVSTLTNEADKDLSRIKRKIPQQNVVLRLIKRETHVCPPATQSHVARTFHQNVFPNFTVVNVEKPPCYLRKFSPDGRHFVAISSDQTSIEIYEYQGPAVAESLLRNARGEYTANSTDQESLAIRSKIFEQFFKLKHLVSVASNGEQLNRECSLFTDNGRFVIVGSASYVPEEPHPNFFDVFRNNESVSPNPRHPLEDYSLHIVDLVNGALSDTRTFKVDKIFLSHNQGLYLYRDTLAVLSVQHQTIHIFQVTAEGTFIDVRKIGRQCYDDDDYVLSHGEPTFRPVREGTINSLKHRLLVFLYRHALHCSEQEGSPRPLRRFFQYFDQFRQLRMWKMQLLDEDHLLIKYASEEVVTLHGSDPNSQPAFFVIYNMITTQARHPLTHLLRLFITRHLFLYLMLL